MMEKFLLFESAKFMCVNIDCEKLANLRIILYKECNKCDVIEQLISWVTVFKLTNFHKAQK